MKTDTIRFRKTVVVRALLTAFCGTATMLAATNVAAQTTAPALQRVEITGSAIKRVDAETSLPVTILKMDELKAQGYSTVEDVVNSVSASQALQGTSQAVGLSTGGASFANFRGLGQNKTLVLLNGRRIANNAIDSSAPDLNMIPFAAIDRVEILRDGASSLYGTDAIGGVINFITRKDFTGGVASVGLDSPQHAGGKSSNFNIGFGKGDLDKDKFNVFGFIDYKNQDVLTTAQRDFGGTKTSGTPYPGIYSQGGGTYSPYAPNCDLQYLVKAGTRCTYLYWKWVDDVPKSERASAMLKGTLNLGGDRQVGLEYFVSRSKVETNIAPVPYSALTVNPGTAFYPGNGITPAPPAGSGIDPTQPLDVRWRDVPNGPRQDSNTNTQQRLVASFDGTAGKWDYQTALSWNQNKVSDDLTGGYTNGDIITNGIATGIINPFGTTQTAAGTALLNSAGVTGTLFTAKGDVVALDGHASREYGDWFGAGRNAALAVGAEVRREKSSEVGNPPFDQLVISSTGFDPSTNNVGSRTVLALYGELNVPVMKTLDVTAALRYDRYSDFGSTTNPKVSFRFQPNSMFLLRGSASTGFRAPSLYDLHQSQQYTNTANNWNDPVRCPNGVAAPGVSAGAACGNQFMSLIGGNPDLKPETSKSATLGLVIQPSPAFDVGLDFWWIQLKHQIAALNDNTVFSDPAKYASTFHRAPDGSLSIDGSQCPGANCGYVSLLTLNQGGVNTNGVDLSTSYRWRTNGLGNVTFRGVGTYVNKYEYQNEENGPWIQSVGVYSGQNPIFRAQYTVSATWAKEAWTAGIANHYKSGYLDQDGTSNVGSYSTWDLYGSWQPTKPLTVTFGVRNVLDTKPPSTVQAATFQVGYDPRFADPFMRTFYLRGTYKF